MLEGDGKSVVLEDAQSICHICSDFRSSEIVIEFLSFPYLIYGSFRQFEIPTESVVWDESIVLDASDFLSETDEEKLLEERSEVLIFPDREDVFFELEEEVVLEIESDLRGKFCENPFGFFVNRDNFFISCFFKSPCLILRLPP